jgi:hypothetical protein
MGELDERLEGLPEESLEAKLPPGVLRDVCARLSASQRAESALRSSIMAYRAVLAWVRPAIIVVLQKSYCSQISIGGDIITGNGLASLRVLSSNAMSAIEIHRWSLPRYSEEETERFCRLALCVRTGPPHGRRQPTPVAKNPRAAAT